MSTASTAPTLAGLVGEDKHPDVAMSGRAATPPPPLTLLEATDAGLLNSKKKRLRQLEEQNAQLREWVQWLQGSEPLQLAQQTEKLRTEVVVLERQAAETRYALEQARAQIVATEETALLQEAGVYEYQHPLSDAVAYKSQLNELKDAVKAMIRSGGAVHAATAWNVNGSVAEGRKMVRDFSKLLLRAYNAEADNLVRTMRPYKLQSAIERLSKSRGTIARLGRTMDIRISETYHRARVVELQLTADYLAKVEEEKERIRAERERQREEEIAQREFEREKARLLKEKSHYASALAKLEAKGDEGGVAELQGKLDEIDTAIAGVEARKANTRAGYVYLISNISSFGAHMVKIGLTRRLDPAERVRELGDASVPFRFDIHAVIFSEDAVGLEGRLHDELADHRVNKVNMRREFFHATPAEVRAVVERITDQQHLLDYHETPEALEWRASRKASAEASSGYADRHCCRLRAPQWR